MLLARNLCTVGYMPCCEVDWCVAGLVTAAESLWIFLYRQRPAMHLPNVNVMILCYTDHGLLSYCVDWSMHVNSEDYNKIRCLHAGAWNSRTARLYENERLRCGYITVSIVLKNMNGVALLTLLSANFALSYDTDTASPQGNYLRYDTLKPLFTSRLVDESQTSSHESSQQVAQLWQRNRTSLIRLRLTSSVIRKVMTDGQKNGRTELRSPRPR